MKRHWIGTFALAILVCGVLAAPAQGWKPADGPLTTPFAEDVSPDDVHAEYPRPQMARAEWMNLNGLWQYAIAPAAEQSVDADEGEILVPFCAESALSGVMRRVGKKNRLWYKRTFEVPADWRGNRVLLHFGAVDWETTVWVNGQEIGRHLGGYDPFTFDISPALKPSGEQEIVVAVWDPTNDGLQARGKQVNSPRGIWYTPVTGIWQTVWLEPVPPASIARLRGVPNIKDGELDLTVWTSGAETTDRIAAAVYVDGVEVTKTEATVGSPLKLRLGDVRLWSPDDPYLYDLEVSLLRDGEAIDTVDSYFGMREISLGKDASGITRMMLNGEFLFQYGTLDQGWWPDGLYTPATDKALLYDLEVLKNLGFNMLREHVKVAPQRFYYHCDRLGLLVWQDMPSPNPGAYKDPAKIDPAADAQFRKELQAMIDTHDNHPCIVVWVPFNEGWGQHDTEEIVAWIKRHDPSRLVINASGWTDRGVGDIHDIHRYPGPGMPEPEEDRAVVLGEFGGLGLPLSGHTWQAEKSWGYRSYEDAESLTDAYVDLMRKLRPLIGRGLSAAVYTQTSDVEIEVNGVMTYDRAVIKLDPTQVVEAHRMLYLPPPVVTPLMPTSQVAGQTWRYTTERPEGGWERPDFDDSKWPEGPGGFGTEGTPGATIRTQWKTSEIWLRRSFELDAIDREADIILEMHHDEDAEVYLNGKQIVAVEGYTTGYDTFELTEDAAAALKVGENVVAVHCRQTDGGQSIDLGISQQKQPQ